jgi:6-phosphogluconolactonase
VHDAVSLSTRNYLLVGSYATAEEAGIHTISVDMQTGAFELLHSTPGDINPSFVVIHPNKRYLYATNEIDLTADLPGGAVSAYAIDTNTGRLRWLGRQSSQSSGPCHLSIDHTARFLFVSNYKGGGFTVLPILADGSLGPATDFIQHTGKGTHPTRQDKAHVHSALPAPNGDYVLVADLGLDKVMIYPFDAQSGKLGHAVAPIEVTAGAGPRHFTFSADARFMYLINELDSTVDVWQYDAEQATYNLIQRINALPQRYTGESWCAEIRLHPNGRFLYGSNRGHDSIVSYRVDQHTGMLSVLGHTPCLGAWPRHFTLDATGHLLVVANQHSNSLVSFTIDSQTGVLTPTNHKLTVAKPTCVQFL